MRKLLFLASILFSSTVFAQHAAYIAVTDTAGFKQQFAAASQKINSIKSDFVQEKNLSMLSEKITSKGKFWFKKDNMVRMEYNQPFQYLMILNKNDIYIKDGQKENKISTKSNKLFQQINQIMVDCVKGTAFSNKDFTVKVFQNNTGYLIEMSPINKTLKDMFKKINVTVDKKQYAVNSIEMLETSGDNTVITFVNKEINSNVSDALFTH
ncbi:outer membrane lipoprotein carrier protein LolA [Panacibacter ginsenosidivorans]|uniref:Outer membrane lipoprotein carrier protein LolA n=1 Tax=Panacibacter ginsenosidivorans TaxID=1813871 RepID=A0A5B8VEI2_9BACT|nr:outer membrane lipoprotein carrier protein LolA [Panacibacter ginsenosidivorans]QEC69455.1 outer membrane lipoprotein carrier protein LolA [Panacibacter ginsenosidivorans]